jgi:hypothetical protein
MLLQNLMKLNAINSFNDDYFVHVKDASRDLADYQHGGKKVQYLYLKPVIIIT